VATKNSASFDARCGAAAAAAAAAEKASAAIFIGSRLFLN